MQNLNSLCRTCLKGNGTAYPLSYTSIGHENVDFAVMLMSCTSICIDPDDLLPHYICENCVQTLVTAYTFKQQCEKCDLFLRTHDSKDKISTISCKSDKNENKSQAIFKETDDTTIKIENKSEVDVCSGKMEKDNIASKNGLKIRKLVETHLNRTNKKIEISGKTKLNSKSKMSKTYKCLECDKQFATCYGLKYHSKHHGGVKNYVCPIENCKKKFLWEPTLRRHMQTHSSEKKYLCYLCGKAYNASDSLRYHIRNHKGERPHLCIHCGKTFKQHVHLKYHMSSHNDERPHICTKCNRSYMGPNQLRRHLNKYCGVGKTPPPRRKAHI